MSVSKPTNTLRIPAAAARSIRSPRRIACTVLAPWNSRPMPRMPSKSPAANRSLPSRWSSRKYRCRPGRRSISASAASTVCGVERAAAFVERVLVAEVAVMRASARHDDRVRDRDTADARSGRDAPVGSPRACACSRRTRSAASGVRLGSRLRNSCQAPSPGPRKTVSACRDASSGSDVGCRPPTHTWTPRARYSVRDLLGSSRRRDVDRHDEQVRHRRPARAAPARARRAAPPRRRDRGSWRGSPDPAAGTART